MTDLLPPNAAPTPWTFNGESAPLSTSGPTTTLVEGRTFCISSQSGDLIDHGPQGLFFVDARFLNQFELRLDGDPVETLGVDQIHAYEATFVSRHVGALKVADAPTVTVRKRTVGNGMTERIEVRNHGGDQAATLVSLLVDADFANLFAVKEARVPKDLTSRSECRGSRLWFEPDDGRQLGLEVKSDVDADVVSPGRLDWSIRLAPGESWSVTVTVIPWLGGEPTGPVDASARLSPQTKMEVWEEKVPVITSDNNTFNLCMDKALSDLASLRIFDPTKPDTPVVAAGAPWFMTLFGRDSLIASWMALIVDPDLAVGVLETLARFQGSKVDPITDEEPGKIMHELRSTGVASAALDDGELYYGTADATPLFVMLVSEVQRWGVDPAIIDRLLPHVDRALAWIENYGDDDGDGYVEYERSDVSGLENQGWKDSWDGIRYADGRVAKAPIALCEVQAYTYGAFRARARLAENAGDPETALKWEAKARKLRENFNRDFWLEDKGYFAVGLDGEKKPIDSCTSNLGHCLWAGIVDDDKAERVADRLLQPDMFSGWGIRTLSNLTPGYNPTGYHVGSVWPHDSAIVAAGLMRYGFSEHAHRVMMAILDAGAASGGRLPELMAGFDRHEFGTPMAYPASCSPQAWSAAAPLLLLRWMLMFDPWANRNRVWVKPSLPEGISAVSVSGIRLGEARLTINYEAGMGDDDFEVEGLPERYDLRRGLRSSAPRDRWT